MKTMYYKVLFIYDNNFHVETIIDGKDYDHACRRYGSDGKSITFIEKLN